MNPRLRTIWRSQGESVSVIERAPEILRLPYIDMPYNVAAVNDHKRQWYRIPLPWMVYGFVFDGSDIVKEACAFALSGPVRSGHDLLYTIPIPNLISGGWSTKTPLVIRKTDDPTEAEFLAYMELMIDTAYTRDDLGNIHNAYVDRKPLSIINAIFEQPHSPEAILFKWQQWADNSGLTTVAEKWNFSPAEHEVSTIDELIRKLDKMQHN